MNQVAWISQIQEDNFENHRSRQKQVLQIPAGILNRLKKKKIVLVIVITPVFEKKSLSTLSCNNK